MIAKLFFKKYLPLFFLIIIQLSTIILFATALDNYFVYYIAVSTLLSAFAFVELCNKVSAPELIMPWFLLLITMPLMGFVLYLVFEIKFKNKFNKSSHQVAKKVQTLGKNFYSCEVKYFSWGKYFFNNIKKYIKNAKKFIFLEFFIIENGKLFDELLNLLKLKIKENVEIFILYDDFGSTNKVSYRFDEQMKELGIHCKKFTRLFPTFSIIHNNRDHRKVCVVDGEVVFVGGTNIADEYVGEKNKFGIWKDGGIRICGEGVNEFSYSFLTYYNLNSKTKIDATKYVSHKKFNVSGKAKNVFSGPYPYNEDLVAQNEILNLIESATNDIHISTPYFVPNKILENALIRKSLQGVKIKIFVPQIPDKKIVNIITKSYYLTMKKYGIEMREFEGGFIHSKNILVDGKFGMVSTINLDYRSFYHNLECGAIFDDKRATNELYNDFVYIDKHSIEGKNDKKTNTFLIKILKVFAPMM